MSRLAAALVVSTASVAFTGCSVVAKPGRELSYAEVQAVQPGLRAAEVLDAYGDPARVDRGPGGRVRSIEYAATDARGGGARLILEFDEREVLVSKRYTGAVVRP